MTDYLKSYPKSHADKISNIVETIYDLSQMTPSGSPVCLSPNSELLRNIPLREVGSILEKLGADEKVILITEYPTKEPTLRITEASEQECYDMLVLPAFEEYMKKAVIKKTNITDLLEQQIASMINNDIARQKLATEAKQTIFNEATKQLNRQNKALPKPSNVQALSQSQVPLKQRANTERSDDILFWITFDNINHRVLLNDVIILAEPKPNSSAYLLIKALTTNPNIQLDLASVCTGDPSAVYRDLGFRKGLKNLFIEVGKGKIKFINPVSRERFDRLENKEPVRVYFKFQSDSLPRHAETN
jgi:hypothetical protein